MLVGTQFVLLALLHDLRLNINPEPPAEIKKTDERVGQLLAKIRLILFAMLL